MKKVKFKLFYLLLCLGLSNEILGQSLVDDANISQAANESSGSFNETIKIISSSKKIFILSNNNQQLGPGDFISLALENKLAARAVVAKVHQGQVGIKILKIYSLAQWTKLRRDTEVQIVRGDDSYFNKKTNEEKKPESTLSKIKSEEDLYTGDVTSNEDAELIEESKSRNIKPDNLVSLSGSYFEASEIPSRGGKMRQPMFGVSWSFQFTDNYFIEGVYGRAMLDSYPAEGSQTLVNQMIARIKYNVKGPAYTFFMPYVGFQSYNISSPDAGKGTSSSQNEEELAAIEDLKKTGPVFGVTILRRLVPGWFIKTDLGTDVLNLGFSIEF